MAGQITTLKELLPQLESVTTAKELGAIIVGCVPSKPRGLKFKLAVEARNCLGFGWSDQTLKHWLSPSRHTEAFAEAARARNRVAVQRWFQEPGNRERHRAAETEWLAKRPTYYADYGRQRCALDPAYRLAKRMRSRVSEALRGRSKVDQTIQLLGCTVGELVVSREVV